MITLVYGPVGETVNDFNYKEWIEDLAAKDWANKDIKIRVSARLPVLLVQIAIIKEDILHDYVEFTTLEDIKDGWKPIKFNKYGRPTENMNVFRFGVYDLNREFLILNRAKEAQDAKMDPNQENLF